MIIYACILRLCDGLPLSGTNDFNKVSEMKVKEGKRLIKLISKKKYLNCQKLSLQGENLSIHCFQNEYTSYMAVCDLDYAHILAYSFLNELIKEFSMLYIPSVVASVKRPFAFIEFDGYLQKVQTKYNNVRSLTSQLGNLPELTEDLNLYPPKYIKLKDLEPSPEIKKNGKSTYPYIAMPVQNGVANGKGPLSDAVILIQPKPITWYGRMALIFSFFCILLDGYRGFVTFVSTDDPEGALTFIHKCSFVFELLVLCNQMYFLRTYSNKRKLITNLCFMGIVVLNITLSNVREAGVTFLYIFTSFTMLIATHRRTIENRLPDHTI